MAAGGSLTFTLLWPPPWFHGKHPSHKVWGQILRGFLFILFCLIPISSQGLETQSEISACFGDYGGLILGAVPSKQSIQKAGLSGLWRIPFSAGESPGGWQPDYCQPTLPTHRSENMNCFRERRDELDKLPSQPGQPIPPVLKWQILRQTLVAWKFTLSYETWIASYEHLYTSRPAVIYSSSNHTATDLIVTIRGKNTSTKWNWGGGCERVKKNCGILRVSPKWTILIFWGSMQDKYTLHQKWAQLGGPCYIS